MHHLLEPSPKLLDAWLAERGLPGYRAAQVRRWLFRRRAAAFDEMTDLPQGLRVELAGDFRIWTSQIVRHTRAADGTEKLLLEWADGERIECVLLRDGPRRTVCISTQVGCFVGCVFCASGIGGLQRSLSSGEIVEQMLRLQQLLGREERVTHVVVMGMGEPLANLKRLLPALDAAGSAAGLGISPRRITISTIGLPRAIYRMADRRCRYHLAVSLHAPDDALRAELVPIADKVPLRKILEAADRYFDASGRRLTFEYVLLGGINDRADHARRLVRLLKGRPAMVNLIPYNPVPDLAWKRPSSAAIDRFRRTLERGGLNVVVRQRKGDKIDAACGQLRRASCKSPGLM